MALVTYFKRDKRRIYCPECGRHLTTGTHGKRFCAYAEDHKSGQPLFEKQEAR